MGLFNKLKNALFEEEEIELPIADTSDTTVATLPKEEPVEKKPEKEKEKKDIDDLLEEESERDLFKAENTFKFPEFDEEEFQTSYNSPIEKEEPILTPKETFDRVKPITFEYDKKPKQTRKETIRKEVEETSVQKKTFKPSPVISPVYGVLDKNYKKEDIMPVQEEKPKKKFDVDAIRKKAFGTLEDDIERSFEQPQEEFYNDSVKNVEDLLSDSADEKIEISEENRRESRTEKRNNTNVIETRSERHAMDLDEEEIIDDYNPIEEDFDTASDLQVLDETNKSEEQKFEEDTLENDLFDLIDSMYDNREDEEE